MIYLKQSTAGQEIPLGYFLDETDGITPLTGLTIANTDIKLHKTGATTLANKNSGGATHIAGGIYYATLDATDTDTLGPMVIFCHPTSALPVRLECEILPANVFDARYGTDYLQVDAVQVEGLDATNQINAACDTALTDYDAPTKAELDAAQASIEAAITALNDLTSGQVGDAVFDEVVEGTWTFRQLLRLYSAALLAKVSGMDANAPIFRDIDDTKNRISGTTDANGNRTAVTLDAS